MFLQIWKVSRDLQPKIKNAFLCISPLGFLPNLEDLSSRPKNTPSGARSGLCVMHCRKKLKRDKYELITVENLCTDSPFDGNIPLTSPSALVSLDLQPPTNYHQDIKLFTCNPQLSRFSFPGPV